MTTSPKIRIKMSDMIQPHFREMWRTKKPYAILLGGRGSFKSSTVSLKLVIQLLKHVGKKEKVNVVVVRENATNLRDSVYAQIVWAIGMLHATHEFRYSISPMKITNRRNGSSFYFYGGDKPERLKSNTVGNVMAIWYEECANFKSEEVFDQTNPTFIRQKPSYVPLVHVYYTYNPPKNPYAWINKWVDSLKGDPRYLVDKSSYLNDELGFTTQQQLDDIKRYKENDPDYYRWLYLGEVIGLGNTIYNMNLFHKVNELPTDDDLIGLAYSIDAGHQTSATTCLCFGITKKKHVYLIDTFYYSPAGRAIKKAPSELSKDIHDFIHKTSENYPRVRILQRTIDSAEGGLRNQYKLDYGIKLHGVNKSLQKTTMIDFVQDLLAQGRFYYIDNENNQIFISEHQQYRWEEKTLNTDKPKVIKEDDHTPDAFQYFCIDNQRLLGLKGRR